MNAHSSLSLRRNRTELWMKLLAGACLVACLVLWCAVSAAQAPKAKDGHWWQSVSADQHTGFLAGYLDCAVYDAGEKQFAGASWDAMEPRISSYYASHPTGLDQSIASVLPEFAPAPPALKPGSGEKYPERHGIFDGEYWRQSTPDQRLGYLLGYLECKSVLRNPKPDFSRDASWYEKQISGWYGVKADDPGAINAARAGRKIADVLYLFRTKRSAAKN
jgi:hypothetical protein